MNTDWRVKNRRISLTQLLVGLLQHARQTAPASPSLQARLHMGVSAQFPAPRDHAFCEIMPPKPGGRARWCRITIAPRMLTASRERQEGVLRHEIGHALLLLHDVDPATHNELACDEAARLLFGAPIYYDEEDVQTTDPTGTTPRPSYLPE